jgi:hypothetical protein
MRYRLRTLLILLAIGPPMLAEWWANVQRYLASRQVEIWIDVGGPGAITIFESQISCSFDDDGMNEQADNSD